MELVVYIGCALFLLFVIALTAGQRQPRVTRGRIHTEVADAEIEAVDIDQMIEARNERRRRRGWPEIGDDLASQTLRDRD